MHIVVNADSSALETLRTRALLEHSLELVTQLRDEDLVAIERLVFHDKRHIRELWVVEHAKQTLVKPFDGRAFTLFILIRRKDRTWVSVQYINILKVILAIAAADNVQFAVYKCHGMSGASIRVRTILGIHHIAFVVFYPCRSRRVKCVEIVEAVGVRA